MLIKLKKFYFISFLCLIFFSSCLKREEYPIVPHIEFKNFVKYVNNAGIEDKGTLVFSFTDGDGDIGLSAGDTLPPYNKGGEYYYDLFITYKELQHGVLTPVVLPLPFNTRLPVITPSGKNKAIKGEMEVNLDIYNPLSTFDTISFDFYIVDRALNKSNMASTSLIVVHK